MLTPPLTNVNRHGSWDAIQDFLPLPLDMDIVLVTITHVKWQGHSSQEVSHEQRDEPAGPAADGGPPLGRGLPAGGRPDRAGAVLRPVRRGQLARPRRADGGPLRLVDAADRRVVQPTWNRGRPD